MLSGEELAFVDGILYGLNKVGMRMTEDKRSLTQDVVDEFVPVYIIDSWSSPILEGQGKWLGARTDIAAYSPGEGSLRPFKELQ